MRTLSDVGEFGLIARVARRAAGQPTRQLVIGIGDDAAVLRPRAGEDLVVSSDACVEGVHFRFAATSARSVGRRALVANLSDLAAMGARPLGFTAAISAPPTLPLARFDELVAGLLVEARRHLCPLIGGNLTSAGETTIAISVLGAVARGRALRRDGLRAGDRLYLTGQLGRAALAQLRSDREGRALRHLPVPRLAAGRALGRLRGRGACIDVSDGLVSDLGHLLEASGVGAEIDLASLPLPRGFARGCRALGVDPVQLALAGGEDYELLFSLRSAAARRTTPAVLARRLGVAVSEIGRVTRNRGLRGAPPAPGFQHF